MNTLGKRMKYSSIYPCLAGLTLIQFLFQLNNNDHTKLNNCEVNFISPKFVFKTLDMKKEFNSKKLEINGPISMNQFLGMFNEKFPVLTIRLIFCKGLLIYENFYQTFVKYI